MAMEMAKQPEQQQVWQPATVEEAWLLKRRLGEIASYVSGGTLLRTQWENGVKLAPLHLISLESIQELSGVQLSEGYASIGAAMNLNECRSHEVLQQYGGLLLKAAQQIAAPSIRHMATVGGNISSLVGDSVPALMAMDAKLVVFRGSARHSLSIREWVQGTAGAREADDIICRVLIPVDSDTPKQPDEWFQFYEKVGRREAFTPSLVTVAGEGRLSEDGVIHEVRLSAGGGSALPDRLPDAEQALSGSRLSEEMLSFIHQTIKNQYRAAEDLFAGSEYRKEASANLITSRLWKLMKS
jgi:xanthine dehydrogenase C subunit